MKLPLLNVHWYKASNPRHDLPPRQGVGDDVTGVSESSGAAASTNLQRRAQSDAAPRNRTAFLGGTLGPKLPLYKDSGGPAAAPTVQRFMYPDSAKGAAQVSTGAPQHRLWTAEEAEFASAMIKSAPKKDRPEVIRQLGITATAHAMLPLKSYLDDKGDALRRTRSSPGLAPDPRNAFTGADGFRDIDLSNPGAPRERSRSRSPKS